MLFSLGLDFAKCSVTGMKPWPGVEPPDQAGNRKSSGEHPHPHAQQKKNSAKQSTTQQSLEMI
ncbi:MAG TPA: hypothetical protein VF472_17120 [Burkholderiaceae bacterium]